MCFKTLPSAGLSAILTMALSEFFLYGFGVALAHRRG
jgi:hypothetical protein